MAPTKKLQISQEAFDAVVNENVEEFGMEMEEALADAVTTFQLQGVDLSGTYICLRCRNAELKAGRGCEDLRA